MDSRESLKAALWTVPIPGSPPSMSIDDAAVGLAFLDMALRQNHVRRITERLLLLEHLAPRCRTEIDISLNLLHQEQRDACEAFQQARQRSVVGGPAHRSPISDEGPAGRGTADSFARPDDTLWVPVARLPRQAVAPIEVRDSTGAKLPRLTQLEVAMPLASGLFQLLRGMLASSPDARVDGNLGRFLYRVDDSRWLVQSALQALFVSRTSPSEAMKRPLSEGTRLGPGHKYRHFVETVLEQYDHLLAPFYSLLDVALNDYLLVIGLPQPREHHLLSYEVPLLATESKGVLIARRLRSKVRGVYQVEYETHVPSSLRSYHLVAETDPTLRIDKMHITSDADQRQGASIASDLRFLAEIAGEQADGAKDRVADKIVELELRTVVGELAQLVTRRRWEADEAKLEWSETRVPAIDALSWASLSGEIPDRKELQSASMLNHPLVRQSSLADAANEVEDLDLGMDYFKENDPASHNAHVYWRRYADAQSSARRIVVRSGISISDATQTRLRVATSYVLAVLFVSYLTAALLTDRLFPFVRSAQFALDGRSDAIVAVLLLVPGFLYSRLDLPPRNSVAARVRMVPRWTAHATMAITILEAAAVAASPSNTVMLLAFATGCSGLAIILGCLWAFGRRSPIDSLRVGNVPTWAENEKVRGRPSELVDMFLMASGAGRE